MDEDELKRENERLRARVAELEARAGAFDAHALRAVFEGTPDALLLIDNTAVYVDANPAACELFGMKREEIIGSPVGSLTKKQGVDVPPLWRSLQADGALRGEFAMRRAGEDVRAFEYQARRDIAPGLHLSSIRDVTEHRRTQEALRVSEEMFSRAFRASPIPIGISTTSEGRFVDVNDAAAKLAGRPREELVGRTSSELEFWGDPTHTERLFTEIHAKGCARRFPTKVRRPSGELVDVLLSTETIDVHGVRCTLGVLLDLTEQRKAEEALRETEEQLRQLQRLEAIGTLAAGIAHDFNNLLSVILSYASMLHGALPTASPLREDVEQIRKASERAADLTRRLLAFGRRQMLAPRVVDLPAIFQGVELMLRRILGEYTALTLDTSSDPGPVLVDPVQLEQVLVNLVVNARDAMPKGGRVSISARDVELGRDDELCLRLELAAGSYVCVSVADDGVGMTRQQRERAFEPFFTTKEKGRGTGLGLAMVYGIVKQSGGGVAVESAEGKGTTMRVYLPRAQRPEEKLAALVAEERSLEVLDGTETVLVVDDEEALRVLVSATLEKRGYRVLSAGSGAEALRVARAHEGPIDVLLSDVVMPEMSGPALAKILCSERPNVRVLYVSGYTDDRAVLEGVRDATVTLLHKPVLGHVLLAKLREVLRG